jgi:hypothetical protein
MAEKNDEWITPVLGLLGVAGAFVASMLLSNSNNQNNNNSLNNNSSLPPPPAQKPCGCQQHKK